MSNGCASMSAWRSPISANRSGIVKIVKSSGSQLSTSSHRIGAETRASGTPRTEYAAAIGDLHADIDDHPFDIAPLLEWAARDEDEGAEAPPEPEES